MPDLDRVQRLVEEAIDGFDDRAVSATLRRCQRIARMRNDFESLFWLELESDDVEGTDKATALRRRSELVGHLDKDEVNPLMLRIVGAFMARRKMRSSKDGNVFGGSLEQLENRIKAMHQHAESFQLPPGMHPVDLARRSDEVMNLKTTLLTSAVEFQEIVDRVRGALYAFLIETERQLDYGRVNAEIFERVRTFVDERLSTVAPEALEQFQSAYRRITENDSEALAQALTSCRRILKSVADHVYPPTSAKIRGRDGKERAMTDDKYLNRLLQFVSDQIGKHGDGAVIQATLDGLGQRLSALQSLSSKGVHDLVTAQEVDTCVIQTYLMVGDVLRLEAGKSALPDAMSADPLTVDAVRQDR